MMFRVLFDSASWTWVSASFSSRSFNLPCLCQIHSFISTHSYLDIPVRPSFWFRRRFDGRFGWYSGLGSSGGCCLSRCSYSLCRCRSIRLCRRFQSRVETRSRIPSSCSRLFGLSLQHSRMDFEFFFWFWVSDRLGDLGRRLQFRIHQPCVIQTNCLRNAYLYISDYL